MRLRTVAVWIVPVLVCGMVAIGAGELVNMMTAGTHDIVRIVIGGLTAGLVYAGIGGAFLYGLPHYRPMLVMLHDAIDAIVGRLRPRAGA